MSTKKKAAQPQNKKQAEKSACNHLPVARIEITSVVGVTLAKIEGNGAGILSCLKGLLRSAKEDKDFARLFNQAVDEMKADEKKKGEKKK